MPLRLAVLFLVSCVLACEKPQASTQATADVQAGEPTDVSSDAAPWVVTVDAASVVTVDAASSVAIYDRATDLEARIAAARRELGDGAAIDVVGDVFVFTAPRRDALYEKSLDLARKAIGAFFNGRFGRRPARLVTVTLFGAKAGYDAFFAARGQTDHVPRFGRYDGKRREIAVNAGLGITTLTHEIVHPLVESDFPEAPDWINEGIASLFEAPVFPRSGEIHGTKNWRHPRLVAALASKDPVRLDALFGMSDDAFHASDEDLHYAMARYACMWLDEHGWLWRFWSAWRDGVAEDPSGARAFEAVVGKAPREADEEWVKWVKGL